MNVCDCLKLVTEVEIGRSIYEKRSRKFTTLNVPRLCPVVHLINVGWTQGRILGIEEN
jgi:hypothetical protein